MPAKTRKPERPKLIADSKTGLSITKSPPGTKVTSEDIGYERLKRRRRKMPRKSAKAFCNEQRGQPAEATTLRASLMPHGLIVIQGTLPNGQYLVLEVHGKRVKVAFFEAPVKPLW